MKERLYFVYRKSSFEIVSLETIFLFDAPDVLNGINIQLFHLFLDVVREIAEEVDACSLFQSLDVDNVVAKFLCLRVEGFVLMREPIAEGTVAVVACGLVVFLFEHCYEEILRDWNVAWQLGCT